MAPMHSDPTADDYRADLGADLPTMCQYFAAESGPVAEDGSLLPPCPSPVDAAIEPRPAGQFAPAFLCAEHANDWIDDHAFHLGLDWVVVPMTEQSASRLAEFPHTAPDQITDPCVHCDHPYAEHAFFPGGEPAPFCIGIYKPGDTTLIDHSCGCEGYAPQEDPTCMYVDDGLDPRPGHEACGRPATVKNPNLDADYDEWYCREHADPAWLAA